MTVRFGSVCSGIEAASVAWEPFGWAAQFVAEIEAFPSALLAHRYPSVPNRGDITAYQDWPDAAIDVLVGGTPCQSFSVAGLRKGLADPRGNLALTYLAIADRYRPEWLVWENVPGVLSSNGGRDFGAFLGGLGELGYGFAYRVLDAQYVRVDGFGRAVPQRRRRVFVVGNSRSWRRSAAVLFERESLSWHSAPRREAGQGVAPTISARPTGGGGLGTDFDCDGGLIASSGSVAHCLNAGAMGRIDYETETMIAHALRGEGFDASEDGTGRGTPIVPVVAKTLTRGAESAGKGGYAGRRQEDDDNLVAIPFDTTQITSASNYSRPQAGDPCHPLAAGAHPPAVAFHSVDFGADASVEVSPTIRRHDPMAVQCGWAVRRLTPTECERLQGFPEIADQVRIEVCEAAKSETVQFAPQPSQSQREWSNKPALVHVLINLERSAVEIHRAGRLLWSASTAARPSTSPLSMPLDAFVHIAALMTQTAVPQTLHGRVESRQSINGSSPRLLGSACVSVSGREIEELAGDAAMFTTAVENCTRSITLQSGQTSQNSGSTLRTLSCCVTTAISSCIPSEIRTGSSFAVIVETTRGYTAIPYRGKSAADGPRYKALGNSMAVNVMRWIGHRIHMVSELVSETRRAA